jgi:hypothetical protein
VLSWCDNSSGVSFGLWNTPGNQFQSNSCLYSCFRLIFKMSPSSNSNNFDSMRSAGKSLISRNFGQLELGYELFLFAHASPLFPLISFVLSRICGTYCLCSISCSYHHFNVDNYPTLTSTLTTLISRSEARICLVMVNRGISRRQDGLVPNLGIYRSRQLLNSFLRPVKTYVTVGEVRGMSRFGS